MESRLTQLRRLRRVAVAALPHFGLSAGTLRLVDHGENTTYRHDGATGRQLLRVHRPQRHGLSIDTTAAIRSELAWLAALRRETSLEVPEPLPSDQGDALAVVTEAGVTRVCTALRWMTGTIRENSVRPVHLHRLGQAMAALHRHADEWTPPAGFVRIRWDHDRFFAGDLVYGDLVATECWRLLPGDLRQRFERVAERLARVMARVDDVGLIHADLHLGNALFEGSSVKLIDFDHCGVGHRLYDLAVAIWESRNEPHYPTLRDALLAGYDRELDVRHLDDFIALRQVGFTLWYTGMAQQNPAFADHLPVVNRWANEMLDLVQPAR